MKQRQEITKMEFLITLNNNIIIQRYFNVSNYNPSARMSVDLYEEVKDISNRLQYYLKQKTLVYMMDNYDQIADDPEVLNTDNTDGSEHFNLYLKIGNETICHRQWDAKIYPPKVRYTMDIRPQVKTILSELSDIFSGENLNYQYLNYTLN
jgi:hypothetical protein